MRCASRRHLGTVWGRPNLGARGKLRNTLRSDGACYLALPHARDELRSWDQLTRGGPAALTPWPEAQALGQDLAALQGCERAVLGPSTLHLYGDLFGLLSASHSTIAFPGMVSSGAVVSTTVMT